MTRGSTPPGWPAGCTTWRTSSPSPADRPAFSGTGNGASRPTAPGNPPRVVPAGHVPPPAGSSGQALPGWRPRDPRHLGSQAEIVAEHAPFLDHQMHPAQAFDVGHRVTGDRDEIGVGAVGKGADQAAAT